MRDRSHDPSCHDRTLLPWRELHLAPPIEPTSSCENTDQHKHVFYCFVLPATMRDQSHDPSCHDRTLLPWRELHLAPPIEPTSSCENTDQDKHVFYCFVLPATMRDRSHDPSCHDRTLLPWRELHLAPPIEPTSSCENTDQDKHVFYCFVFWATML